MTDAYRQQTGPTEVPNLQGVLHERERVLWTGRPDLRFLDKKIRLFRLIKLWFESPASFALRTDYATARAFLGLTPEEADEVERLLSKCKRN